MRGLAALNVLLAHTTGYFTRPAWLEFLVDYTPVKLLLDSGLAVNLFFVLSGVVLSINFLADANNRNTPTNYRFDFYFFQRLIRIFFPFWAILFISSLAHEYFYSCILTDPQNLACHLWEKDLSVKSLLLEASLVKANFSYYLIPQAWTLAIELKVSLLMPIFIYFANRSHLWLFVFCLSCTLIFKLPHYVFNFYCGVLIAKHYFQINQIMLGSKKWVSLISLLGGVLFCCLPKLLGYNYHEYIYFGVFCYSVGCSLILISALAYRKILDHASLIYLGKMSYSLYLTHMLIILLFSSRFLSLINSFHITGMLAKISVIVVSVFVALLVAACTYEFIEKPLLNLGKKCLHLYSRSIFCKLYLNESLSLNR